MVKEMTMTPGVLSTSLTHLPFFFVTWSIFFSVAIVSFVLQIRASRQKLSAKQFLQHCFPFRPWSGRSARMDVVLYVAKKFTDKLFTPLEYVLTVFASSCVAGLLGHLIPGHSPAEPGLATVIVCSLALFVVVDFSNYITHYLQHFVPVLWELHKVHHSATFLNPFTTARQHPLGDCFDALVSAVLMGGTAGLFAFAFKFSIADIFLLVATANTIGTAIVLDPLRHSHFPISFGALDRVLLSPHMHQLHHSSKLEHWDRNFGNKLSVWDWLFDTGYKPAKDEDIVYGLGKPEERDYEALGGVYVGPLVKMWRLATRQGAGSSYPDAYRPNDTSAGPKPFTARVLWRKRENFASSPRPRALNVAESNNAVLN